MKDPLQPAKRKPGFRILESSTARMEYFDTATANKSDRVVRFESEKGEYLTWLLAPYGRDKLNDYIAQHGGHEYKLVTIAMRLIPQGGVFVDVGASLGPWALVIAKARPDVTVEAFEPEWMFFHQLCANIFLNHLPNARAYRLALGSRRAVERLHLPDSGNRAGSSLLPGTGRAVETATVVALDEVGLKPHVMKLDVSGYEHEVVEGAMQTLKAEQTIFFFTSPDPAVHGGDEVRQRRAELFAFIEVQLGYDVRPISNEHYVAHPPKRRAEVIAAIAEG